MRHASIVAFCLALLIPFGGAASGQVTVAPQPAATDGSADPGPPKPGKYDVVAGGARWQATITATAGRDFAVDGTVSDLPNSARARRPSRLTGTLYRDGRFRGALYDEGQSEGARVDGEWEKGGLRITKIDVKLRGGEGYRSMDAWLLLAPVGPKIAQRPPVAAPKPQSPPAGSFGLVSKVLGHAPPPAEGNSSISSGSMDEQSFRVELRMKPPSTGFATVAHHFSSPLSSWLKPGQVVELTCWSEATRQGRDTPYVGSNCQWYVEGDGAAVLDSTKTFAGTASDGTFHPSSQAVTHFRVLKSGTIKITAAQGGALWGSSDNWNPVTYVYKFGMAPTVNR